MLGVAVVPEEIQRLDAPRLWPLEQFKGSYRDHMLWGTYRPGCYLGERPGRSRGTRPSACEPSADLLIVSAAWGWKGEWEKPVGERKFTHAYG
jgi:hypothetical protein